MKEKIALCVDEYSCTNPEALGLDDENLDAQDWLNVYVGGEAARNEVVNAEDVYEAWVAPCGDVEPINLAAALKADRPELTVRLIDFEGGGSLLSRAHTAMIDEVMGRQAFMERYSREKERSRRAASASADFRPTMPLAQAEAPKHALSGTVATSPTERKEEAMLVKPRLFQQVRPKPQALALATPAQLATHGRGFLLPIVSGSGGAGKSTISVLSAYVAHALGHKTLLLDYDLQFGDAAVMAGIENPLTVDELIERPERLEQELQKTNGPALVAAPTRLEMSEGIVREIPSLLEYLSPLFDVIIANTGAAWADQHAALLERSTAVLFLVDQRSSSVRACRHALELCGRCGIATGQFQFALNRCAKGAPLTSMDVSCALQGASVAELRDGGRDVEDYLAAGAVQELLESGNELCASLQHVLGGILPAANAQAAEAARVQRTKPAGKRRGRHVGKRKGWGK